MWQPYTVSSREDAGAKLNAPRWQSERVLLLLLLLLLLCRCCSARTNAN
jgi:hypothetical protein